MDASLASWLSRPLEIATVAWNAGASPLGFIDPWALFIEDPRNVNKIAYYRNFRAKHLCLKFLINGGPFTYGRIMFYYTPLASASSNTPYRDNLSYNVGVAPTAVTTAVSASQRPFIILDPTRSQGGCFEIPFIYPYNWVDIPSSDWRRLGQLSWIALTPLSNAGGAAGVNVSIKVFAWLVDPEFCVPTTSLPTLPAQSSAGDEYVGMISKPATAISNMAGQLSTMPIIGTYARATQMAAGAAAGLAKMIGFSRPSILTDNAPMRPTYVSDLAVCDRSDYVMKLTTDSKQELSINPAIMGIGESDELDLAKISAKETYLGQCTWATSAAEGTILASMPVTPNQWIGVVPAGYTLRNVFLPTACCFAAWPFKYWRGNVKFRFQVVASQYHRGRIKVVYDPAIAPIATKTNALYSRIIDIQETSDFTVTVGWNALKGMLQVQSGALTTGTSSTFKPNGLSVAPTFDYHNGALTLFVENELILPIPGVTADISILVWVSMEDAVYNFPVADVIQSLTPSPPFVASTGLEPALENFDVGNIKPVADLNNVYFGETIPSFRVMMKRYSDYLVGTFVGLSSTLPSFSFTNFRQFPLLPGSDAQGVHATSTAVKTNFMPLNYINYVATAFSCYRGSVKYKFQVTGETTTGKQALVALAQGISSTAPAVLSLGAAATNDQFAAASLVRWIASTNGVAVTDYSRNPFLETEIPFWNNYKFKNPKAHASNNSTYASEGINLVFPEVLGTGRVSFQSYIAAGEDFTLGFYTGPPALWLNSYNVY